MPRTVFALFIVAGLATIVSGWQVPSGDFDLARHRQVLVTLLGLALLASAFLASLRLPAAVAAALSKLSFVAIAWTGSAPQISTLLLATEVVFALLLTCLSVHLALEAKREARWNGAPAWRLGS